MSANESPRRNRSLLQIVSDPALWKRTSLPLLLGFFVVANLLFGRWRVALEEQRRQNLLQRNLSPERPGAVVRYDWSVGEDLGRYLRYVPDARKNPLVVVTGMSQMYAINDEKPDDRIIAELLDDALAPKGVRVFGAAAPNLSNEEALFIFTTLLADPATRPDVLVYGVCFDKLRNVDLRPSFARMLQARPDIAKSWRMIAEGAAATHPLASRKMLTSLEAPEVPKPEETGTLEHRLRDVAGRALPMVAARQELNVAVQVNLFQLRNIVFRIDSSSKRPILAARYDLNKDLLSLLLDVAERQGVKVVLYVIPLNPRAETPYVPEQYADFKTWVEDLAHRRGVPFANLEDVVPAADWGEIEGQPDFKHFRGEGHRRTAGAVLSHFEPVLLDARAHRSASR